MLFRSVSGGFIEVITPLMNKLSIADYLANSFEIESGYLTGKVLGKIIDRSAKAEFLRELRTKYGAEQTFAIGDGANDIDMVKAADIGIAFCAKPALQAVADIVINERDLRQLLQYL